MFLKQSNESQTRCYNKKKNFFSVLGNTLTDLHFLLKFTFTRNQNGITLESLLFFSLHKKAYQNKLQYKSNYVLFKICQICLTVNLVGFSFTKLFHLE